MAKRLKSLSARLGALGISPDLEEIIPLAGEITVLWSLTEWHLERIIWSYTDTEARIGEAITGALGNISKIEILAALAGKIENDEKVVEHLNHLAACYNVCRQNRNTVIHAIFRKSQDGKPLAVKSHKTKGFHAFRVGRKDLVRVASEIAATYTYAKSIDACIWAPYQPRLGRDTPVPAWPEKPVLPRKLETHPFQVGQTVSPHPLDQ
jgi:hypothetical protein